MSHSAPPPKPAAAGPAKDAKQPAAPVKPNDTVEKNAKNVFNTAAKTPFAPTPIKKAPNAPSAQAEHAAQVASVASGEDSQHNSQPNAAVKIPVRMGGASTARVPSAGPGGEGRTTLNMLPGTADPEPSPDAKKRMKAGQKPGAPPKDAGKDAKGAPGKPGAVPGAGGGVSPSLKAKVAAVPPKPAGVIQDVDTLAYQGKLALLMGNPKDTVDVEDAKFTFDPKGARVALEFKVSSMTWKAACLTLGLPLPTEKGVKKFRFRATLKPPMVEKHKDKLFDGNPELRLHATENNAPVIVDLTQYENHEVSPYA